MDPELEAFIPSFPAADLSDPVTGATILPGCPAPHPRSIRRTWR